MSTPTPRSSKSLASRNRYLAVLAGFIFVVLFTCGARASTVWEYRVVDANFHNRQLETLLNTNGAAGWELVEINQQGVAIFKRKK